MSDQPNAREAKVLGYLCLGDVEPAAKFSGVDKVTIDGLLSKGWIEEAHDDEYGVDGYRITSAGEQAWEKA